MNVAQLASLLDARIANQPVAQIIVHGAPEPGGSKRSIGNGRIVDANPRARGWKDRVAQAAGEQYAGEVMRGALRVEMHFTQPRPKGHYGTGRNSAVRRPSAPHWPVTRPDVLKLARAAEDACTGVLWADDSQIVEELLRKDYGDQAGCLIRVWELS